jgi:hypothetical protein
MKHLELFEGYSLILEKNKQKKKDKKWLKKAIKNPGALHAALDVPEEDTIPMSKIDDKIDYLHNKVDRTKKETKLLRRLNLAKTLKSKKWMKKGTSGGSKDDSEK